MDGEAPQEVCDIVLSLAVMGVAVLFVVVVLRVLWICVVGYVGVQSASIGTAQCDGGGLERERTNWQILYGRIGPFINLSTQDLNLATQDVAAGGDFSATDTLTNGTAVTNNNAVTNS